jgi:leucyl/phenylalanyl-tRNA--protein transferase
MIIRLPRLGASPLSPFPPPDQALDEPAGLLAMGGDLRPERLLNAYAQGVFPWYSAGEPILWWCPDPRVLFRTEEFRLPSRFRRSLRRSAWVVRADTAFEAVLDACAQTPREGQDGTWITPQMREAYLALHQLDHAHSIEVFEGPAAGNRLVGGLYGVAVGRMFYGESMVSLASGGSKVALGALAHRLRAWGWPLIDGQVENPHLIRLGAERWPRPRFLAEIAVLTAQQGRTGGWREDFGTLAAAELGQDRVCP